MTYSDYLDIDVRTPEHKRRSDVLTVYEACKSNKSSKNHKMKPRTNKLDSTKTREVKNRTKEMKREFMSKL